MQIQKMGQWKGATIQEYVREELACFSTGMLTAMKSKFNFVNVTVTAIHNITNIAVYLEYNTTISVIR